MSRRFRMTTALDVDDVLLECVPYAIKLANEKYKFDPPGPLGQARYTRGRNI